MNNQTPLIKKQQINWTLIATFSYSHKKITVLIKLFQKIARI